MTRSGAADDFGVIRHRMDSIEKRLTEHHIKLKTSGKTLVEYILVLGRGKVANEQNKIKITEAIRLFRRTA
jgi:hypothetical protein